MLSTARLDKDQAALWPRGAGLNVYRYKKLLEGIEFFCGERKEDKYERVILRGQ